MGKRNSGEYAQQVAEQVEVSRARTRSDEYQPPMSTDDGDVEPWVWDPVYEEAVPWTETYFPMTGPPPDSDRSAAERRLAFDDDDERTASGWKRSTPKRDTSQGLEISDGTTSHLLRRKEARKLVNGYEVDS